MTDPTVPTAVGQVALLVRDVDASIGFYRDTLGLERVGTWGDLVFFRAGATRLYCTRVDETAWKPLSTVYLTVADLDGRRRAPRTGRGHRHRAAGTHSHA